jgi:hypothetical protein
LGLVGREDNVGVQEEKPVEVQKDSEAQKDTQVKEAQKETKVKEAKKVKIIVKRVIRKGCERFACRDRLGARCRGQLCPRFDARMPQAGSQHRVPE